MTIKEQIDAEYNNSSIRQLMYWKYGEDAQCFAELDIGYGAGNQEFANDVCALLDYAKELEDKATQFNGAWQPIETAPKDGTRIILTKEGGPVWCDCRWREMKRVPDRWESFVGAVMFEPTHWMPIPEAP